MLAQQPVVDAQRVLARTAELAAVIGDARIDEYAIAGLHGRDAGADRLDDTGAVRADDVGEFSRSSGESFQNEQVEMIQRRCTNCDAHFSRPRSGCVRNVADWDVLETARAGQSHCPHIAPEPRVPSPQPLATAGMSA